MVHADWTTLASTATARRALAPRRLRPSSLQTTTAAAPSLIGEHIGSVSGYVIGGAASTCSTVSGSRYCDSGLCTECWWFLAATAAICRCVVP
jgi:hypothetical protein